MRLRGGGAGGVVRGAVGGGGAGRGRGRVAEDEEFDEGAEEEDDGELAEEEALAEGEAGKGRGSEVSAVLGDWGVYPGGRGEGEELTRIAIVVGGEVVERMRLASCWTVDGAG